MLKFGEATVNTLNRLENQRSRRGWLSENRTCLFLCSLEEGCPAQATTSIGIPITANIMIANPTKMVATPVTFAALPFRILLFVSLISPLKRLPAPSAIAQTPQTMVMICSIAFLFIVDGGNQRG